MRKVTGERGGNEEKVREGTKLMERGRNGKDVMGGGE